MLKWLLIGLLAVLLYRWVMRVPRYTHIVSAEHLMELARGLGRALPVAVEHVDKSPAVDAFAVGYAFMTSANVAVFYTIAKATDGRFEHHLSMTHQRKPLSKEIAAFLGAGMGRMLGLSGMKGVLAQSKTGTFHFIVPFSAADHAALVSRGIDELDEQVARQRFELAMEDRPHLLNNLGKIEVKERAT
jgi:hypothetical protein